MQITHSLAHPRTHLQHRHRAILSGPEPRLRFVVGELPAQPPHALLSAATQAIQHEEFATCARVQICSRRSTACV